MKKIAAIILSLACIACTSNNGTNEDFIRNMYNNSLFEEEAFLEKHCTAELLEKLAAEYDYEGEGYATWMFRSGAQDGTSDEHGITDVKDAGNGWYVYDGIDMGVNFSRNIKLSQSNGKIMIEDICGFNTEEAEMFEFIIADSGVTCLDVRTPQEWADGHIAHSINIDIQGEGFERKALESLDKNDVIAVYCRSGRRSREACNVLARMGFSGYELRGGILAWQEEGKPVEKED